MLTECELRLYINQLKIVKLPGFGDPPALGHPERYRCRTRGHLTEILLVYSNMNLKYYATSLLFIEENSKTVKGG